MVKFVVIFCYVQFITVYNCPEIVEITEQRVRKFHMRMVIRISLVADDNIRSLKPLLFLKRLCFLFLEKISMILNC